MRRKLREPFMINPRRKRAHRNPDYFSTGGTFSHRFDEPPARSFGESFDPSWLISSPTKQSKRKGKTMATATATKPVKSAWAKKKAKMMREGTYEAYKRKVKKASAERSGVKSNKSASAKRVTSKKVAGTPKKGIRRLRAKSILVSRGTGNKGLSIAMRNPRRKNRHRLVNRNPLGSELMVVNPIRKHRIKHRRNPVGFLKALQPKTLLPLIMFGGAGAVTTSIAPLAVRKFLPNVPMTNLVKYGTQAVVAVGGGLLVTKFADKSKGIAWIVGSLSLVASEAIVTIILPKLGLGAFTEEMGAFTENIDGYGGYGNGDDIVDTDDTEEIEDNSGNQDYSGLGESIDTVSLGY